VFALRILALFGGVLVLGLMAAQVASASVTRQQASKTALRVAKVHKGKAPVAVFMMLQPVAKGAAITEIGPAKYASTRKVKPKLLARTSTRERSWMFYVDSMPYGQFQHGGRIVLIGATSGRVLLSKTTRYSPYVNGKLPPFLGNTRRYQAKTWRVFYRPWTQKAKTVPLQRSTFQTNPDLRSDLAHALGAQRTCIVIAGARGPGVTGEVSARSATFVEYYFRGLAKLDADVGVWRYAPASSTTFADYLEEVASEQTCTNMLVYIAAQGTASGTPLVMLDTAKVQELRAKQLLKLMRAHRSTKFSLVMDASSAARFYTLLKKEKNLAAFLAPRGAKNIAFGFLPEYKVGKKIRKNVANPRRIDEFTNDLLYGLTAFSSSPSEVSYAIAQSGGEQGSTAAWMLGRGGRLSMGSGASDGVGASSDSLFERTPSSPPPPVVIPNTAPVSADAAVSTNEDTAVALPFSASDLESDAITYEIVTQPAHGTVTAVSPFTYTPAANYFGADTLTYHAVDARGAIGPPATVTIAVASAEDAPQVTLDAAATFTEGDPQLTLTPLATVVDVDDVVRPIASVTISIAGYVTAEDVLGFVDTAPISGTWDAGSGTLQLSGSGTVAEYEAAIRTITYDNLMTHVTGGTRTLTATVATATGALSSSSLALAVIPINDAPSTSGFAISATEDVAEPFTFSGTDPENDLLDYDIVIAPAHGTITGSGAARSYTPDADFTGSDTFTFHARDTHGATSADETVTITVAATNDAPLVTLDAALAYTENATATTLSPGAIVSDVDDTVLTGAVVQITGGLVPAEDALAFATIGSISGVYAPGTGTLTLTGGGTVAEYQSALRAVTYENTSDAPSTAPRTVTVTAADALVSSLATTMLINIAALNDPPVASSFALAVDEDTATPFSMSGSDAESDPLTYAIATPPAHGSISGTGANRTYTPDTDYNGPDSFTYHATDANGGVSADATVTITVSDLDDLPVVTLGTSLTFNEGDAAAAIMPTATVSDADDANLTGAVIKLTASCTSPEDVIAFANTATITGTFTPGTCTMTLAGTDTVANYQAALRAVTYRNTSDAPNTSSRTVSVTATDASAGVSVAVTATITIIAANDEPVLNPSVGATSYTEQASAVAVDAALTATDPDDNQLGGATVQITSGLLSSDVLAYTPITGITGTYSAVTGTLTFSGTSSVANYQTILRSVTFASTSDSPGASRTVEFAVRDAALWSLAKTKTITVTAVNDAPVVTTTVAPLAYTENAGQAVVDSAVVVADADTATLASATISITGAYSAGEDSLAWSDLDPLDGITLDVPGSDAQTVHLVGIGTLAAYQAALRAVTYVNSSDTPSPTQRTVTFTVNDGTDPSAATTRTIDVTATDDPPVAVDDAEIVAKDAPATAVLVLTNDTDIDAGPMTITAVTQTANATIVITGGGTGLTYQPNATYCNDDGKGDDDFTYTLNGGSVAHVLVTISCASNHPPVAGDLSLTGNDGAIGNTPLVYDDPDDAAPTATLAHKTVTGDLLSTSTDPDAGDTIAITAGTIVTNDGGSAVIEADGDFTYTPKGATSCTDHSDYFDYVVHDIDGATDTGRVTLDVLGCVWYVKNDAAAGGLGDAATPFKTLTAGISAAGSTANTVISIDKGDGTSTGLVGPFTIGSGVTVNGTGAALVVDPDGATPTLTPQTLLAADAAGFPVLTASGANILNPTNASTIRGVELDPSGSGIAIDASGRTGVTVDTVRIIDAGLDATGNALKGTTTTFGLTVSNFTVDTDGSGIDLSGGTAAFLAAGTISITTRTRLAIHQIATTTMSEAEFDSITVSAGTGGGVDIGGINGPVTLGTTLLSLTTTGASPALKLVNPGTFTIPSTGTATISTTGGPAISASTMANGSSLSIDSATATNSTSNGIVWNPGAASTATLSIAAGSLSGGASAGFTNTGGAGDVFYGGTVGPNMVTSAQIVISSRTNGDVTFDGDIVDNPTTGGGISVASGAVGVGSLVFNGNVSLNNGMLPTPAFSHSGTGNGYAIKFNGGLHITSTSTSAAGGGFVAGGASGNTILSIKGAGNTITTASGVPFKTTYTSFDDTDGVTFEKITSTGALNGISIANAGATGFFHLTGSGGPCNDAATCTGASITGVTTLGAGVSLTSVAAPVTLTNMYIHGLGDGIVSSGSGTGVGASNLTISDNHIESNGDVSTDHGIELMNTTGTNTLTNNFVGGSYGNDLTIGGTTTGATTWTITGNTFTSSRDSNVKLGAPGGQSAGFTFTGNTLGGFATPLASGAVVTPLASSNSIALAFPAAASAKVNIANNTMTGAQSHAIALTTAAATAAGLVELTIANNSIGDATAGSGSALGRGIDLDLAGPGKLYASVTGNTIRHYYTNGMHYYGHNAAGGQYEVTATGNTVSDGDHPAGADHGVWFQGGVTASDTIPICFDFGGAGALANVAAGSANGGSDIFVTKGNNTVLKPAGWDGVTAFGTYMTARNTGTPTISNSGTINTAANPASCSQPTLP
jgi:hypothetical protein